jgi:hypothetical protein
MKDRACMALTPVDSAGPSCFPRLKTNALGLVWLRVFEPCPSERSPPEPL